MVYSLNRIAVFFTIAFAFVAANTCCSLCNADIVIPEIVHAEPKTDVEIGLAMLTPNDSETASNDQTEMNSLSIEEVEYSCTSVKLDQGVTVPEPTLPIGLYLAGAALFASRRSRRRSQVAV